MIDVIDMKVLWDQQREFMLLLQEKGKFPQFPVDLTSKDGQFLLKQISYECGDELHEARQLLKIKRHRGPTMSEVDRDAYVEEVTDALHYLFEIAIASGITLEELCEAYLKKGEINVQRVLAT